MHIHHISGHQHFVSGYFVLFGRKRDLRRRYGRREHIYQRDFHLIQRRLRSRYIQLAECKSAVLNGYRFIHSCMAASFKGQTFP
ncbi:hypothetical protein D3C75_1177000 [compost metagenome]